MKRSRKWVCLIGFRSKQDQNRNIIISLSVLGHSAAGYWVLSDYTVFPVTVFPVTGNCGCSVRDEFSKEEQAQFEIFVLVAYFWAV